MLHPELEALDCEMCQRYYLGEDGTPLVLQGGPHPEYVPRQGEPDCIEACPKKRPGMEPWCASNARFFRRYREARALGATEMERGDHLFRYLSGVVAEHEAQVYQVLQLRMMHGR